MRTILATFAFVFAATASKAADFPVYVTHRDGDVWAIDAIYKGSTTHVAFCGRQRDCEWLTDAANQKAQAMR